MRLLTQIIGAAAPALFMLALTASALGGSRHPTGEFAQFGECPQQPETINNCVYSVSSGGSFTIGKTTVPLKTPVTLQGGYDSTGATIEVYGAENGETISKTPQPVPGGLRGATAPGWWPAWLREWFDEGIAEGQTGMTATLELAASPTAVALSTEDLLLKKGTAIGLPARIKLDNPLLGGSCYIGSSTEPLQIDFTTGRSGDLEGTPGSRSFNPEYTFGSVKGTRLVNATFAAPTATGCGGILSYFVDPLVNSILGLPSASGKNSAILEGNFQNAAASAVRESE
jgi:hypothetical protein